MKKMVNVSILVAMVSLAIGIFSRITLTPLWFGIEANAFLRFANTCLLFAIAVGLVQIVKSK